MKPTRWTVVGTVAALGVSTAVVTASLGGISLADRDAGDGVVVPASTSQLPDLPARASEPAVSGDAVDPSPESADSPGESALDSPEPAPARAVAPAAPAPAPAPRATVDSADSPDTAPARVQAPAPAPVQPDSPDSPASPASADSAD